MSMESCCRLGTQKPQSFLKHLETLDEALISMETQHGLVAGSMKAGLISSIDVMDVLHMCLLLQNKTIDTKRPLYLV